MNDRELADGMFDLTPVDGASVGNVSLRDDWIEWAKSKGDTVDVADYWRVRQLLLDSGKLALGKGKGGSVKRDLDWEPPVDIFANDDANKQGEGVPVGGVPAITAKPAPVRTAESDLYDPACKSIASGWAVSELGLPASSFVVCVSAYQGKANTGGKWTRPDITLVYARRFFYLGPKVEVVTFEVKPWDGLGVDGVFEAAAHSVRAHRVYLLAEVPDEHEDEFFESDGYDRLERECLRFGVGLATFAKAGNPETWQVRVRPESHSPDPSEVEAWVAQCFKNDGGALQSLVEAVFEPEKKAAR